MSFGEILSSELHKQYVVGITYCFHTDLDEFYAMVNFVSPGMLGDAKSFRLLYADSIIRSRDKTSSDDQKRIGQKRYAFF